MARTHCTRIAERQRARSEVRVRSGGVERVRSDGVRPPDAFPGRVKGSCGACTRTRWKATKISCARAYHQGDASRSISRAMMMNPGSGAGQVAPSACVIKASHQFELRPEEPWTRPRHLHRDRRGTAVLGSVVQQGRQSHLAGWRTPVFLRATDRGRRKRQATPHGRRAPALAAARRRTPHARVARRPNGACRTAPRDARRNAPPGRAATGCRHSWGDMLRGLSADKVTAERLKLAVTGRVTSHETWINRDLALKA